MIIELLQAFGLIFLAEMGDKTQILAMAFATKYKIRNVVLGIFLGSLFNHALAVLLGSNLQQIIPLSTLSIIAGVSFVVFGLWSLKLDNEEAKNKVSTYGPIVTVSLAFFIGELGDKTQLTAIALSTDAQYPLFILMGTVLGMVVTGLLGIFIGIKLGHKIDEFYIKVGSSIVFLFFGTIKLINSLPNQLLTPTNYFLYVFIVGFAAYVLILPSIKLRKVGSSTTFQQTAHKLHSYYTDMYKQLEEICLGKNHCGTCGGNKCLVGYTKNIIKNAQNGKEFDYSFIAQNALKKDFDQAKVLESLKLTVEFLNDRWTNPQIIKVHEVRKNLEFIVFGTHINAGTYEEYLQKIKGIDIKFHRAIT